MALPLGTADRGHEFARFYAAYAPRVAGVARRWVEEASVDDVVQETLLRAYDAAIDLDGGDAWPWLATVARRVCHDVHRGRRRLTLVADPEPTAAASPPQARPAGDLVEEFARAGYVASALEGLPARQRTLLVRRHVEGRGCAEIAADEGSSVEAVKSALARARHAFQARYEGWRGVVPGLLHGAATRIRSASAALGRALPAAPLTPSLRTGAVGVLAALLALGLAPSGEAATPEGPAGPSCCHRLDRGAPAPATTAADVPDVPVPGHPGVDPGGAPASPVDSVGGRRISVQPPKSPDAPPTPESPSLISNLDPWPAVELPPVIEPLALAGAPSPDEALTAAGSGVAGVAVVTSSLVSGVEARLTGLL